MENLNRNIDKHDDLISNIMGQAVKNKTFRNRNLSVVSRSIVAGKNNEECDGDGDRNGNGNSKMMLREIAQDVRNTNNRLQEWNDRIKHLEHTLQVQDCELNKVLMEKHELKNEIKTLRRQENDNCRINNKHNELRETRLFQKTIKELERALLLANKENNELRADMTSNKTDFAVREEENKKNETEISNLRTELEINRRIVHVKRDLISKEITDELKETYRLEIRNEITDEISDKTTREVEVKLKEEYERKANNIQDQLDKVSNNCVALHEELDLSKDIIEDLRRMGQSIPLLENEVVRLQRIIYNMEDNRDVALAELEEKYERHVETIKIHFSREREQHEFKREKNECEARVREEVTNKLKGEIQVLIEKVSELTVDYENLQTTTGEENQLQVKKYSRQMKEQKEELLEKFTKEKEDYGKQIRQVINDTKKLEFGDISSKVNELRDEKQVLQNTIIEIEKTNSITKGECEKNLEDLNQSKKLIKGFKNEILKLKKSKKDLTGLVEKQKKQCTDALNDLEKTRGHFKYNLLVESEEKIIKLENEVHDLKSVAERMGKQTLATKEGISSDVEFPGTGNTIQLRNEVRNLKSIIEQLREQSLKNSDVISVQALPSKTYETEKNNYQTNEMTVIELKDKIRSLESLIEQLTKESLVKSLMVDEFKTREKLRDTEIERMAQELIDSVSQSETSKSELSKLKDIVSQKETENLQLNQRMEELRTSPNACTKDLNEICDRFEASTKKSAPLLEYEEEIASLNKKIIEYNFDAENCRCKSSKMIKSGNESTEFIWSKGCNISKHMEQRVERLRVMLKVAENIIESDRNKFLKMERSLKKKLDTCNEEIECLHLEISRLEDTVCKSQETLIEATKDEDVSLLRNIETEKIQLQSELENMRKCNTNLKEKLVDSKRFLSNTDTKALCTDRNELTAKIRFLEKASFNVVSCHEEEKRGYEKIILELEDELNTFKTKYLKMKNDLQKSKFQLSEAIISWRSETDELINGSKNPKSIRCNMQHDSSFSLPYKCVEENVGSDLHDDMSDFKSSRNEADETKINGTDSHAAEDTISVTDNLIQFKHDFDRFLGDTTTVTTDANSSNCKTNTTTNSDDDGDDNAVFCQDNKYDIEIGELRDGPDIETVLSPRPHQDDAKEEQNRHKHSFTFRRRKKLQVELGVRERSFPNRSVCLKAESRDDNISIIKHGCNFKSRDPVPSSGFSMSKELLNTVEDCRGNEGGYVYNSMKSLQNTSKSSLTCDEKPFDEGSCK